MSSLNVNSSFSIEKDYLGELTKDEVIEKEGQTFPLLKGLQRLAHENRGGVKEVRSKIIGVPTKENKIACASVSYHFKDGSVFEGSADANTSSYDKPYSDHLVACAESAAEARALRRAFNISTVSVNEVGRLDNLSTRPTNSPIEDTTITGILNVGKRKGLKTEKGIIDRFSLDINSLKELTVKEGRDLMRRLNRLKASK